MNDVYIVGGGRSLCGFDWQRLRDKNVFAINRAFEVIPWAHVVYFSDLRVWQWYGDAMKKHHGEKVTGARRLDGGSVKYYKFTGLTGLDLNPRCLRHGNSSGYAAINLAVHYGAKKIYLLGYDMKFVSDKQHWHDGYKVVNRPGVFTKMIPHFDSLKKPLADHGVEVLNVCPDSELMTFQKVSFTEAGL